LYGKLRIAVASEGKQGLNDRVAEKLARAPYYTIIDVEECSVKNVKVVENPAPSFSHGAGPIAVKTLEDEKVEVLIAPKPGGSVQTLLQEHSIRNMTADPGMKVMEALEHALKTLRKCEKIKA